METYSSEFLLIPHDRIGVIIGKNGSTKSEIGRKTETRLEVDSKDGEVEVIQLGTPYKYLKAIKIVKAIARGFSPEKAFRLLNDDAILEFIDLAQILGKNRSLQKVKRGRVIGSHGKAREEIERDTGAFVSVQGKTIGIIGTSEEVGKARIAIEMLLSGAAHSSMYSFLKRKKLTEKFEL